MYIDIFSLIIGAVLWELLSTYIWQFIMPAIKKRKTIKTSEKVDRVKATKSASNYKGTCIGFVHPNEDESH